MSTARLLVALTALLGANLAGPSPARADPDLCYGGTTYGRWDLPTRPGDTGFAQGVLVAGGNVPVFSVSATLTELLTPALSLRIGEIKGYLYDPNSPSAIPVYAVKGEWQGSAVGDTGDWAADIIDLDTGEVVGQMEGTYRDPGPYTHRVVGEFKGDWVICDRP